MIKHINWDGISLKVLDQKKLPQEVNWLECKTLEDVFKIIRNMNVRGAPLIGIVAGFGIVVHLKEKKYKNVSDLEKGIEEAVQLLSQSRPTAINLFWALQRMQDVFQINKDKKPDEIFSLLEKEAKDIWQGDIEISRKMAEYGEKFIEDGDSVLTHCNAGGLATGGYGTAVGVFFKAREQGKNFLVYVDETRPVLQGARLTCWELKQEEIEYKLISDNMAGFLMQQGKIKKIFVGADRIVKNGGFANKIGTYSLACLAKIHKIPFYVVAPSSSFDLTLETEKNIPIEQRNPEEIIYINGQPIAPVDSDVENPAFDITPPALITAIICEKGVLFPPFDKNIEEVF